MFRIYERIGRTQTSFAIDSTIPAGSAPLQIIELVLRCIAGLENNLTISLLLAGDAANSSIAIPKGSKLNYFELYDVERPYR